MISLTICNGADVDKPPPEESRMTRKPYSTPTVTDLGDAVEQTQGAAGGFWEIFGTQWGPPPPPPGGDPDDPDGFGR
jgi:hypothetical protein